MMKYKIIPDDIIYLGKSFDDEPISIYLSKKLSDNLNTFIVSLILI